MQKLQKIIVENGIIVYLIMSIQRKMVCMKYTISGLPLTPPEKLIADDFIKHMAVDKKSRAGKLHLVLLRKIGEAILTSDFSESLFIEVLHEFCEA